MMHSLLLPLLSQWPNGLFNQKPLQCALQSICALGESVKPAKVTAEDWASGVAIKVRIAVAHVRKLAQQPALLMRRCKNLPAESVTKVHALIAQYGAAKMRFQQDCKEEEQPNAQPASPQEAQLPDLPQDQTAQIPDLPQGQSAQLPDFTLFANSPKVQKRLPESAKAIPKEKTVMSPKKIGLLMDIMSLHPRPPGKAMQKKQVQIARGEDEGSHAKGKKKAKGRGKAKGTATANAKLKARCKAKAKSKAKGKATHKGDAQVPLQPTAPLQQAHVDAMMTKKAKGKSKAHAQPKAKCTAQTMEMKRARFAELSAELPEGAAHAEGAPETQPTMTAQTSGTGPCVQCHKMWYKSTGAYGIREKGGAQLCQVLLKGRSKETAAELAMQIIGQLQDGMPLAEVKLKLAQSKSELELAPSAGEDAD